MPIDCTHSDQFCGFFKFAAGGLIAGYPEHGVPLRQLLGVQLASFSKQVDISGTEVILHIASAICLATLINELAVNAAKRGALSLSTGKVSLQWFIDEQSDPATLRFLWEETGGPTAVSRKRAGFNRANIEEMARALGKPQIDYFPGGLRCEVELLLDEVCLHKQQRRKENESV
jgi:two-component sensor histidine kinase